MPNANDMRFALGQIAYHLYGGGMITRVKIKSWHAGQRGKAATYIVKTPDETIEDIPDAELYHSKVNAEAAYQELCASRIAYHQHQVNVWEDTLRQGCEFTGDSIDLENDNESE